MASSDRQSDYSSLVPSRTQGAIDRTERWRVSGRFGDLTAAQLTAILWKLDQGWLDDWADLCEFALCDDTLMSLYASRANRVLQASWKVKPNEFGDPTKAKLAAEFCQEQMGKLLNFTEMLRYVLHATAVGLSATALEWDSYQSSTGQLTYYLRKGHFRHPHRFRYDDQWRPRLYDGGRQMSAGNMWGRVLDPRKWLIHQHYEIVGYPNVSGFMRGAIWVWLFRRWTDKFGIQSLERFGDPYIYAKVPKNTPNAVRERAREDLENLSNDHAGVIEDGVTIESLAGMSGQTESMHGTFMDRYAARLATLVLGVADAVAPGANGARGAVETRTGAMTDPRMVVDGTSIGETWSAQVFGWMLEFNRHRFAGERLPTPSYEAQTASDEVKTDSQDLAEQGGGLTPEISTQPGGDTLAAAAAENATKAADTALNGAQVASMLEIVQAVASGQIPRDAAQGIIKRAFQMDDAAANEALGSVGQGFVPTPKDDGKSGDTATLSVTAPPDPKALSRSAQERRTVKPKRTRTPSPAPGTLPIFTLSQGKLAEMLRDESDDPAP